jgi:hypothetical protein
MRFTPDTPAQDLATALKYSCHCSTIHNANFVRGELAEQVSFGHICLLMWSQAQHLSMRLQLGPFGSIPQMRRLLEAPRMDPRSRLLLLAFIVLAYY